MIGVVYLIYNSNHGSKSIYPIEVPLCRAGNISDSSFGEFDSGSHFFEH